MIIIFILFLIILIIYSLFKQLTKKHDYWEKRNVPHIKPRLLFGNYRENILQRTYVAEISRDICKRFPNKPYIGSFYGTEPALIIQDPDIIRTVLVRDFYYFSGREISNYVHLEKMTNNLTSFGGDEWKVLRTNMTPLFTISKIKNMFPLIRRCSGDLEDLLKMETKLSQSINTRSLLARYMMDCVMSCVFGVDANTMKADVGENPFIVMGERIFDTSVMQNVKMVCRVMWPSIFYGLGFKAFDEKMSTYFLNIISEVSEARERYVSTRNDFIDLFLKWKKNSYITSDSMSNIKTGENRIVKMAVNDEMVVGQLITLFAAGFETSSATMAYVLYELAKNKPIQDRLIKEIDSYLQKHNDVIEYECVNEMPYLEACIEETLRLYPVMGILTREVMDEYTFPSGLCLEKETRIHIPVFQIQRDPKYFPEPEVFRPERFLAEERKNIKPFTYIPFGEGPRKCIGRRFAKMPIHAGLLTILKNYRIELAENTPMKLQFKPISLVLQPTTALNLLFLPRHHI